MLPERASLHVLSTQTYMDALFEQRAKGHVLPQSPVTHSLAHHVCSSLQDTTQPCNMSAREFKSNSEDAGRRQRTAESTSVYREVFLRDRGRDVSDVAELVFADAGGRTAHALRLTLQSEET